MIRTPLATHYISDRISKYFIIAVRQRSYLINYILQQELLILVGKSLRRNYFRLKGQDDDRILRSTGTVNPITARNQLRPQCFGILPKLGDDIGVGLKEVDRRAGGRRQQRRQCCREGIRGRRDTLVVHNLLRTSAETSTGDEWAGQRSHNHVDLCRINILVLCHTTTGPSENAKRPRFIEDESELVLKLQLDLLDVSTNSIREVERLTILGRLTTSP